VLWNNKFMLRHAEHLAALAEKSSADAQDRVRCLARKLFERKTTLEEDQAWVAYAKKHGLANLARVLLNSSEFLFID
jgi:hypothetical protein